MAGTGVPTSARVPQQVSKASRRLYLDSRLHDFLGRMTPTRAMTMMAIVTVVVVTRRLVLVLVLVRMRLRLRLLDGIRRHSGFCAGAPESGAECRGVGQACM